MRLSKAVALSARQHTACLSHFVQIFFFFTPLCVSASLCAGVMCLRKLLVLRRGNACSRVS